MEGFAAQALVVRAAVSRAGGAGAPSTKYSLSFIWKERSLGVTVDQVSKTGQR